MNSFAHTGPLLGLALLLLVLKIRCGFTFGCCAKHTTSQLNYEVTHESL